MGRIYDLQQWIVLLVNVIVGVTSQIILKQAVLNINGAIDRRPYEILRIFLDKTFYIALVFCVINLLIYIYLLKNVGLGYLFSLYVSLSIVMLTVYDHVYGKFPLKFETAAGLVMIIAGVVIVEFTR